MAMYLRLFVASSCLFALSAHAAAPTSGTLTSANTASNPLTYTAGPFNDTNNSTPLFNTTLMCDANNPCDQFALTIDLPDDYAIKNPNTYIRLTFKRDIAGDTLQDFVLTDLGSLPNGPNFVGFASNLDDTTTQTYLVARGGKRTVQVTTVPTNASGSNLKASIALVKIADDPGSTALPYAATGIAPRFAKYTPKDFPGLGLAAAEPSIGFNPKTGSVFFINTLDVLRVKFDDSTQPAQATWVSKHGNISNVATLDPILASDPVTGRIFSLQLAGTQSLAEYSDDDGETWLPGGTGFPSSGVDHQTIGTGPFPTGGTVPFVHPLYANATYYCSQGIADAFCSRSDDGGVNFNPAVTIYTASDCVGLHGHVKVAPSGTVYVPNKGCGLGTLSVLSDGAPAAVISKDGGVTWNVSLVSMAPSGLTTKSDPAIGIGQDNTVYFAYAPYENHLRVAVSKDEGGSWINDVDVGAIAGIHYSEFPAVVAGSAGRAAVAFLGTKFPVAADDTKLDFPGIWHFYIATTYDYGAHWFVADVMPDDIVQGPGGIGSSGSNRNLLDFIDMTIDDKGRVLVSVADGCLGGCSAALTGHFTRVAAIVRQTGGRSLLAKFDAAEPTVPAPVRVSGYRTKSYSVLNLAADNGGAPLVGYNVYRKTGAGTETQLVSGYSAATYVDNSATDVGAVYTYRATASNASGTGGFGNAFTPKVDEKALVTSATCTLPGMTYLDNTGEMESQPATRDLKSFSVSEPTSQPGKLVFTLTPVTAAPPNQAGATFYALFDHPNGRRYSLALDATATTAGYFDGRWYESASGEGADTQQLVTAGVPALDSATFDSTTGSAVFVLDKAKWGLNTGDMLMNVHATTRPAAGQGQVFQIEEAGYDVSYPIVGNDFCAKGAVLPAPVIAATTTPTPPSSGGVTPVTPVITTPVGTASSGQVDTGRFGGGALPAAALLVLTGLGALRRRRRH